jgi:hypothetical protein
MTLFKINYQKRKNQELFRTLEQPDNLYLLNTQNYIPIYRKFFLLDNSNYNSINLNQKWYISSFKQISEENENVLICNVKNTQNNKIKQRHVFFKMAPLLDPFKYLVGKYNIEDKRLFQLPSISSTDEDVMPKLLNENNCSYIDGFFLYLSSCLLHYHNFIHGVDFYGSFLSIKRDFKINIYDDLEFLITSEFFNKHKNILFTVEDYSHLEEIFGENQSRELKKPIKIEYNHNITLNSHISTSELDNIYGDIFENTYENSGESIDLNDLKEFNLNISDLNKDNQSQSQSYSCKSSSTCSSRSSYTDENNDNNQIKDCNNCNETKLYDYNERKDNTDLENDFENVEEEEEKDEEEEEEEEDENDEEVNDESSFEEETIYVTIPRFPVNVIAMEYCENTFDDLIQNNDLSEEQWLSALMQIVMILITYQDCFAFTHNDLHTNNIMYTYTNEKYIYYQYNKTIYKVPTFGMIFKIIDFGRSIYKFNGKIFYSDSFELGGDASTQYNSEPYYNDKKPRLEPNFSFDLCRLACSIFDYLFETVPSMADYDNLDTIQKLILDWCLDDKGLNVLYKSDGTDRYPDFKLYKMIARCVHNHTPHAQLERPEFKQFIFKGTTDKLDIIEINKMQCYM